MHPQRRLIQFISLAVFDRTAEDLLDDDDLRLIQQTLQEHPDSGSVVGGSGGLRKLRISLSGRGKRGGARLIYLYVEIRSVIYLMALFAKNEMEDISEAGYSLLARLAKQLREET